MKIKMSDLIKDIKVGGGKLEKDYFGKPQLMAKVGMKINKKKMLFFKIKAFFCSLFNINIEIIDDTENIHIKDAIDMG